MVVLILFFISLFEGFLERAFSIGKSVNGFPLVMNSYLSEVNLLFLFVNNV